MRDDFRVEPSRHPRWVIGWFILDAIVALAPPLYWLADGAATPILGLPGAVFYFVAVGVFISASILAAYWAESCQTETDR